MPSTDEKTSTAPEPVCCPTCGQTLPPSEALTIRDEYGYVGTFERPTHIRDVTGAVHRVQD